MRIYDSITVKETDSVKISDSIIKSPKVNISYQKTNDNRNEQITSIESNIITHKNSIKDSSNIYLHEPWTNILSVRNNLTVQNLKKEKIFTDTGYKTATILQNSNNIFHKEKLFFPASTFVLSSFLLAMLILALAKVTYRKYMKQFLNAIVNYSEANKLYEDRNIMIDRLFLVMNFVFVVSGGLFLYFLLTELEPTISEKHPYLFLLTCFSAIVILYFYKYLFGKVLGFILLKVQVFNEYLYSSFLYYKIIGIFLLPICLLLYIVSSEYKISIIISSLVIISLMLILSIFRATRIILQKDILLFYWILYLCTVEFLPAILLYKFLRSYS